MPPKGSKSAPSELGRVFPHGNGFRVQATVSGVPEKGPYRSTRARANVDLRQAQSAQTHEEYVSILEQLRREADLLAPANASSGDVSGVVQPAAGAKAMAQSAKTSSSNSGSGVEHHAGGATSSGVSQPAACTSQQQERTNSSDSSGIEQPVACSKNKEDAQPRKRLRLEAQATGSQLGLHDVKSTSSGGSLAKRGRSIAQPAARAKVVTQSNTGLGENRPVKRVSAAMENSSSGVAQSAAAEQFPSHARCVGTRERSADLNNEGNRKTLLLQLKRPHYDAIKERRKLWEARPLFDGYFRQTIYDKLAVVGNAAILQSGAGTNDRVCIVEVRRYVPRGMSYPLEDMVVELGADLLPDVANTRGRTEIYESLYGFQRCARGFVAMRLEWPNEASAPSTAEGGFNQEQDSGDPHPIVQSSGDPHPTAQAATRSGLEQLLGKNARVAIETVSSGSAHLPASSDEQDVLLLEIDPRHYDAIKSRRQQWEARPLFRDNGAGCEPSLDDELATVGRKVILQRGPGTGRARIAETSLMRISEVRRYTSVQDMVSELAADLLPDHTDPAHVYTDLYGALVCDRGFVAMRLE